jgi:hypothetical protein
MNTTKQILQDIEMAKAVSEPDEQSHWDRLQKLIKLIECLNEVTGLTEIELLTKWQSALAKKGDEAGIESLDQIKMLYIN